MRNGGYWVAPIYLLREFIKTYNVVQLAPFGHEFLRVLGATPLGPAIDSTQAVRAKFFSIDFLRTRFRSLLDAVSIPWLRVSQAFLIFV